MKKFLALILAVLMVAGMLAGCGSTPAAPKAETPAAEAPVEAAPVEEKENVTIEVWIAQVDWADAWDVMEAKFEEEHPWIQVEHVGLGEDSTFLETRHAAGDLPDVIQANNGAKMNQLVAEDLLVDISGYECAAVMPDSYKAAYTHNGKLVGMCQGAAFSCMFFNMAILNEAGWDAPPATWDELIQCCADIKDKVGIQPIAVAAGKHTTSWMITELIIANTLCDELTQEGYQNGMLDGTFEIGNYPELVEKLDAIAPYFVVGSGAAMEEDAATYMAQGQAAICLAGNWNGGIIIDAIAEASGDEANAVASLPAFGSADRTWISVSPEDAFCITVADRSEAEQEAVDTFFNWVFQPENFRLIQNARQTVPVITNMTEEYIVLRDAMVPVVAEMGAAPFVLMGFNLYTAEFRDLLVSDMAGVMSGDITAEKYFADLAALLPNSYLNK